jgi:PD-(D/E)XK endonuclease
MNTKIKGDIAETWFLADMVQRGYKVAIPYGENWRYDLIVDRGFKLERVQVKYVESGGESFVVKCHSSSIQSGSQYSQKQYTADEIDWIAVYDASMARGYYLPISTVGNQPQIVLRISPAKNGQTKGVRWAKDFENF